MEFRRGIVTSLGKHGSRLTTCRPL